MAWKKCAGSSLVGLAMIAALGLGEARAGFDSGVLAEAKHAEQVGDYAAALSLYNKAQQYGEPRDVTIIRMARVLVKQGKVEDAKRMIMSFLKDENPFHIDARMALSELLQMQNDTSGALKEIDTLERLRPEYVAAKERKGLIYFDQKEYDAAIDHLTQYLRLKPDSLKARLTRAQAFMKKNDPTSAVNDLVKLAEQNPYSLEVREYLGEAYWMAGNYRECEKAWLTALKLSGNSIKFLEKMADVSLKLGKVSSAMGYYSESIHADPARVDIGLKLGKMYLVQGEKEKAIEEFKRELSVNPGFDAAQYQLVKIWTGESRYDAAGSLLKEWVAKFPDRAWASIAYAKILVQINRYDLAETVVRKSIKASGNAIEPILYLAFLKQSLGDLPAGIEILKDAEKIYPKNATIKYDLALLYQRTGDAKQAITKYREVPGDSALAEKASIGLEALLTEQRDAANPKPRVQAEVIEGEDSGSRTAEVGIAEPRPQKPQSGNATRATVLPVEKKADTAARAVASSPPVSGQGRYEIVKPGETLATFSFRVYGTHRKWKNIFDANRDVLSDPNAVEKGMRLRVPETENPTQ